MEIPKHACMLPKPSSYGELHPTANCWQRIRCHGRFSTTESSSLSHLTDKRRNLWLFAAIFLEIICRNRYRALLLPCEWHYGTLVFLRSRKSLELERQRQLATGGGFVWHPYSPAKFYFDCFLWIVNAFSGLYLPVQVFVSCANPADPFVLTTDFLTFLDMLVCFCVGYTDEDLKEITLDPKKIALHYLKGPFLVDLIAAMPWQLYTPFSDCRYPSHTVFYPIKFLRYGAVYKKRASIMEHVNMPYFCNVVITVIFKLVLFFNYMTYWQYQVPVIYLLWHGRENMGKAELDWLTLLDVNTETHGVVKYITNLYYVCGRCIGAGYLIPITNYVMPEMIQNCITALVSYVFLIYCFISVLRLVMCSQSYFLFDCAMHDLEKYMNMKVLPKGLQSKIKMYINYKFGGSYMDENAILNTINDQIKHDINMHECRKLLISVPAFKRFPIALVNTLIFNLKQEVYIPGQEVIKCGDKIQSMYFIYHGTVAMKNENGKELKHLNDGENFGEEALVNPDEPSRFTVTVLEITEIYALNKEDYSACIEAYPDIQRRLPDELPSYPDQQ